MWEDIGLSNMPTWPFLADDEEEQVRIGGRFSCNCVEGGRAAGMRPGARAVAMEPACHT